MTAFLFYLVWLNINKMGLKSAKTLTMLSLHPTLKACAKSTDCQNIIYENSFYYLFANKFVIAIAKCLVFLISGFLKLC